MNRVGVISLSLGGYGVYGVKVHQSTMKMRARGRFGLLSHPSHKTLRTSLSKDTRGILSGWILRRINFFKKNWLPKLSNSSRFLRVFYTFRGLH